MGVGEIGRNYVSDVRGNGLNHGLTLGGGILIGMGIESKFGVTKKVKREVKSWWNSTFIIPNTKKEKLRRY